jgi:PAS domain S-box-containing protein
MHEMDKGDSGFPASAELRRHAEQRLRDNDAGPPKGMAEVDVRALLHELQVHQIELEMQNEELQRAHDAAQAASEEYYELFDFAPVAYFVWDPEGRILDVNLAGADLLGIKRTNLIQTRFGLYVAVDHRTAFADFCRRLLATDSQQNCEIQVVKHGKPVQVLVEGVTASLRRGQIRHCCAAVVDITQQIQVKELAAANLALKAEIAARQEAEKALIASEDRQRAQ